MPKVIAIACDTEFTHFNKESGDMITAGMVEILEDYTLGRQGYFEARPSGIKYFTSGAQEVHGISYFKASTFPTRKESCISMLNWLSPLQSLFPLPMVMHGLGKLDYKWMESHFRKEEMHYSLYKAFNEADCIDTITLARKHLKHIQEPIDLNHKGELVGKYSLPNVARFYGLHNELDHHNALSDTIVAAKIYCNIMKGINTYTGELDFGE